MLVRKSFVFSVYFQVKFRFKLFQWAFCLMKDLKQFSKWDFLRINYRIKVQDFSSEVDARMANSKGAFISEFEVIIVNNSSSHLSYVSISKKTTFHYENIITSYAASK